MTGSSQARSPRYYRSVHLKEFRYISVHLCQTELPQLAQHSDSSGEMPTKMQCIRGGQGKRQSGLLNRTTKFTWAIDLNKQLLLFINKCYKRYNMIQISILIEHAVLGLALTSPVHSVLLRTYRCHRSYL